jgi:hypothetical protein
MDPARRRQFLLSPLSPPPQNAREHSNKLYWCPKDWQESGTLYSRQFYWSTNRWTCDLHVAARPRESWGIFFWRG